MYKYISVIGILVFNSNSYAYDYTESVCGNETIDFIKRVEGWEDKPYKDIVGVNTIGYGFTKEFLSDLNIDFNDINKNNSEEIIRRYCNIINNKYLNDTFLTTYQKIATFSLIYNVGELTFKKSTLYRKSKLSKMQNKEVCTELSKYIYAGGVVIQGLKNRRKLECGIMR